MSSNQWRGAPRLYWPIWADPTSGEPSARRTIQARRRPSAVPFACRCCGHKSVGLPTREPPGFVMRCARCGTEYVAANDPGDDVQAAIDLSQKNRRLADSIR